MSFLRPRPQNGATRNPRERRRRCYLGPCEQAPPPGRPFVLQQQKALCGSLAFELLPWHFCVCKTLKTASRHAAPCPPAPAGPLPPPRAQHLIKHDHKHAVGVHKRPSLLVAGSERNLIFVRPRALQIVSCSRCHGTRSSPACQAYCSKWYLGSSISGRKLSFKFVAGCVVLMAKQNVSAPWYTPFQCPTLHFNAQSGACRTA